MKHQLSESVWDILICPYCGGPLTPTDHGAQCAECNEIYTYNQGGQLDLRLKKPKTDTISLELGTALLPEEGFEFNALQPNPAPEIDFSKIKVPWHLTKTLISHFPKPKGEASLMLDLGCGEGIHENIAEHAGFNWVGLDYSIPAAPIRGDGHALPFRDSAFEFILSIAVLEHIQHPVVMMKEAFRVLKPGGKFIGTVSFLEPFHNNSYYHHTHLGTYNSLSSAGFNIEQVGPSPDWPGLIALAEMALFRQMPAALTKALVLPLQWLHRAWWKLGYIITRNPRATETYRQLSTTGAFTFIATKEI